MIFLFVLKSQIQHMPCVGFFVVFGQSDGPKLPEGFRRKGVARDDQSMVFNVHAQVYRVGLGRGAIMKSCLKQGLNRSAHIQGICKALCIAERTILITLPVLGVEKNSTSGPIFLWRNKYPKLWI